MEAKLSVKYNEIMLTENTMLLVNWPISRHVGMPLPAQSRNISTQYLDRFVEQVHPHRTSRYIRKASTKTRAICVP